MTSGIMTAGTEDLQGLQWGLAQELKYSYQKGVLSRLQRSTSHFQMEQYGQVDYQSRHYPLFYVKAGKWRDTNKPTVLISGGVHGYEKGGIEAALYFLENVAEKYAESYDILVYPCISPAAYEIDSRWNMKRQDPNRRFIADSDVAESRQFIDSIDRLGRRFLLTIDLHEVLPEDLRIAVQQGPSAGLDLSTFPDSFFLIETCAKREARLGSMIVKAVEAIVPVCKSDKILGFESAGGVINDLGTLSGLCMTFLVESGYTSQALTTETYAGHLSMDKRVAVQIAVIETALNEAMSERH